MQTLPTGKNSCALVLAFATLFLGGCSAQDAPARTQAAKEQLTKLGNHVIRAGDAMVDPLEDAGNTAGSAVDATKSVLTSVGDGVLALAGRSDKPKKNAQPK